MEIKIDKKKLENNVDKIYILEKVLMMLEPLSTTNPTNSERLLKTIGKIRTKKIDLQMEVLDFIEIIE